MNLSITVPVKRSISFERTFYHVGFYESICKNVKTHKKNNSLATINLCGKTSEKMGFGGFSHPSNLCVIDN